MSEMDAGEHLARCSTLTRNNRVMTGIRSIPREWSLSDLREKSDDDLLALPGVGPTTLKFIKKFLSGMYQEWAWARIHQDIKRYSEGYPGTYVFVHRETLPAGAKPSIDVGEILALLDKEGIGLLGLKQLLTDAKVKRCGVCDECLEGLGCRDFPICQRCGTNLDGELCTDETCPYSDHTQDWSYTLEVSDGQSV